MAAKKVLGSARPVVTSVSQESSDRDMQIVTVQGLYSDLESARAATYCPSGYTVESSTVASSDDGFGVMTIRCVKYQQGQSFTAERTTFRIDMESVQYDLEDHPHLAIARSTILKWLATDPTMREVTSSSGGTSYQWVDEEGIGHEVSGALALKFINAYMSGIKTFHRYFPIIEKISVFKNPPGMIISGRSFSSGSPRFSRDVGKFNPPPLSLSGYSSNHWFKSKDSWVNNADTTWTRTEQWTYSPESSTGNNAWIYNNLT